MKKYLVHNVLRFKPLVGALYSTNYLLPKYTKDKDIT